MIRALGIPDTHPSLLVDVWLGGVLGYKEVDLVASFP